MMQCDTNMVEYSIAMIQYNTIKCNLIIIF